MDRHGSLARIKPEYVMTRSDLVEPPMSESDWEDLRRGLRLFHAFEFWDAHEAWEGIWRRHRSNSRVFVQGLIQLAAACYQVRRGICHGAIKHFSNAHHKLGQFPDGFLGVRVVALCHAIETCQKEIDRLGPANLGAFPVGVFPVIGLREET
ncbi:MAG: DUF309 domain-containing protein [bacterium]|nr:DUF309 domain-containing protein [bacterium]